MTVCSTSNLDEKCEWLKKENTGCSWNEFSEFYLSSDSKQHNEGSLGTRGTGGARTNKRAKKTASATRRKGKETVLQEIPFTVVGADKEQPIAQSARAEENERSHVKVVVRTATVVQNAP